MKETVWKLVVANMDVPGGQARSGDSFYFWHIQHTSFRAARGEIPLDNSSFTQGARRCCPCPLCGKWPVSEGWDVSTGCNLALSRHPKVPEALLCLSDPLSCSWSADDQSLKAHRRGEGCLPTEGLSLSVPASNTSRSFTSGKHTQHSAGTCSLGKYEAVL